MTADFEVVAADAAAAAIIEELHHASFDEPWSAADVSKILAMPGAFSFLAVRTGHAGRKPVGFLLGWCAAGEGEIISVGIEPRLRRRGIGAHLVSAALTHGRAQGANRLALEVACDNEPAIGLYKSKGFLVAGTRPNYYRKGSERRSDAYIMTIELTQ